MKAERYRPIFYIQSWDFFFFNKVIFIFVFLWCQGLNLGTSTMIVNLFVSPFCFVSVVLYVTGLYHPIGTLSQGKIALDLEFISLQSSPYQNFVLNYLYFSDSFNDFLPNYNQQEHCSAVNSYSMPRSGTLPLSVRMLSCIYHNISTQMIEVFGEMIFRNVL